VLRAALVGAAEEARADQLTLACVQVALRGEHGLEPRGGCQDRRKREASGHERSIDQRGRGLKRAGPNQWVRLTPVAFVADRAASYGSLVSFERIEG
jgi:hypothetical protein